MSGAALDAILDGRLHIDDVTDAMDAVVTDFANVNHFFTR